VLRLIPSLVLLPLVGWATDHFEKRKIMIASNAVRAVLVLGYLLVQSKETLWILYVIVSHHDFICIFARFNHRHRRSQKWG